jgi:uncharacterized membrane protein (GlpM family)
MANRSAKSPRRFQTLVILPAFTNGAVFALLCACFLFENATSQGLTIATAIAIILITSWVGVIRPF